MKLESSDIMFDEDSYLCYKVCQLLLSDSNSDELIKYNSSLCSFDFLSFFLMFISALLQEDYIGPLMKKNVLKYLNNVRFSNDIDSDRIHLINTIIRLINIQEGENYLDYYRQEMYKRTHNRQYLVYPYNSFIKENEDRLIESMQFDYLVLISHSNLVTDDEFYDNYYQEIISDLRYFETINCILEEYPERLLDPVFYQRYIIIINAFLKNQNNNYGYHSLIRFNNRVEKKVNCLLKR